MSIPIFPNEHHPSDRTPIRTSTPFPFHDCYHWAYNGLTVRVRCNLKKYDDRVAVKVSAKEHVRMNIQFRDDGKQISRKFMNAKIAEDSATRRALHAYSPSSHHSRLSATSDDADTDCLGVNGTRSADGTSRKEPSDEDSWPAEPLEDILLMDVFDLLHHDDDREETLPLVDLWFDLEQHISEGGILSPFDLDKKLDAITKIVRAARSRHPELPFPRRNGKLDMDSENDMSLDEDADEDEEDGIHEQRRR